MTSVSLRSERLHEREDEMYRRGWFGGAASVTSTKVLNRICAGDAGVVTTEEQTPMTRIISGI